MISRTLLLLTAALITAPLTYAASDGEGPGIRPEIQGKVGVEQPELGPRPEHAKPEAGKAEGSGPFGHFDSDRSGGVSQQEFIKAVRDHVGKTGGGERKPEGGGERKPGERRPEGGGEGAMAEKMQAAVSHAEKVFKSSDTNKDESLNSEEFRAAFIALMPRGGNKESTGLRQ